AATPATTNAIVSITPSLELTQWLALAMAFALVQGLISFRVFNRRGRGYFGRALRKVRGPVFLSIIFLSTLAIFVFEFLFGQLSSDRPLSVFAAWLMTLLLMLAPDYLQRNVMEIAELERYGNVLVKTLRSRRIAVTSLLYWGLTRVRQADNVDLHTPPGLRRLRIEF